MTMCPRLLVFLECQFPSHGIQAARIRTMDTKTWRSFLVLWRNSRRKDANSAVRAAKARPSATASPHAAAPHMPPRAPSRFHP